MSSNLPEQRTSGDFTLGGDHEISEVKNVMAMAREGDLGGCLVKLNELRRIGSSLASFQLALIEKYMNSEFMRSPYFVEMIKESAERGNQYAKNAKILKKNTSAFKKLCNIIEGFSNKNNSAYFHYFETEIGWPSYENRSLYIGSVEASDYEKTRDCKFWLALRASNEAEFCIMAKFQLRSDGYLVTSFERIFSRHDENGFISDIDEKIINLIDHEMNQPNMDDNCDYWYEIRD